MTKQYRYTGNRAGAIASAAFVSGVFFVLASWIFVLFVVMPEGGVRIATRDNFILGIGLA